MIKKGLLGVVLTLALTCVPIQVNSVKAEGAQVNSNSSIIYATNSPTPGFTTNKLIPYVLNEKEIQTALGNYSDVIQKLKLHAGYYVFENGKYSLNDANVYVLISLGSRPTTGYGIKVVTGEDIEGISKIVIQEMSPSSDMITGKMITYPYIIVRLSQATPNVRVVTDSGLELSSLKGYSDILGSNWTDLSARKNVPTNKQWTITFNKDFDSSKVTEDNIYVKDSSGIKFPVELLSEANNKTVKVTPVEKYKEGQTYYLFISDNIYSNQSAASDSSGYRMKFKIKGKLKVEVPVKNEANCYIVSDKYENVPLFDAASNKQVGFLSKGFSFNMVNVQNGKAYISIPVPDSSDSNKATNKQFYVTTEYLEKVYKEPFIIPMIISSDMIKIKANAPIYTVENDNKQCIMKISQDIGPMYFIQKTTKGYQFVLSNNLVYVQPEDVEVIKN